MGTCVDLMRTECTTDSLTVAHERLASMAQLIPLEADNNAHTYRVSEGGDIIRRDNAPHMVLDL